MQKVIHVDYGMGDKSYSDRLKELNSYLEQGWIVIQAQPVFQVVSCSDGYKCRGEYGVTFIIQKD